MTSESPSKTLIIAEAGVNHNGSLDLAFDLIGAAAKAGADVVKFQTFKAKSLLTQSASKADYQLQTTNSEESQFEMIKKLELSEKMHLDLIAECTKCGIRFASTGFDEGSVDLLCDLGIDLLKIPSGEITNVPYLRHVGSKGIPVILSTGMSELKEVKEALDILMRSGVQKEKVTVLHCNTEYPTPMADVNLNAMLTMRDELGVEVGYSDHTQGIEVPIAAVALGAKVIEKHFTLDTKLEGPDHEASLEPSELSQMVVSIRNVERVMGDGIKRPSPSEMKNIRVARKSIVARENILQGEVFSEKNLCVKRPGNGLSPSRWDEVMGQSSIRNFKADELIEL
ncbi:MAG TPA: N-acetylneuraminate synthase [Candidatus Poseidoniales archaeon]|nr:MAG TPA: N-acetylneuraminate synthase [Candidatus Poseidoniales archaeon]HII87683.1 N-acetylneuraminate synthase [Candidatus Poseidoniaceae archaeon]